MKTEGSEEHPFVETLFERLIEVHWSGGGIGVLQVDLPEGIDFTFSPFSPGSIPALAGGDHIDRAALPGPITEIPLTGSAALATLYDDLDILWIIDSVVFPDSPFHSEAEYTAYKAGYVLPDARFAEVTDLRGLASDVRPGSGISGWPHDGSWATFDYAGNGPGPPPGEPFWGLGQHRVTSESKRQAVRRIWVLDFASARIGNQTVTISGSGGHDDKLPSYSMIFSLRMFSGNVVLTRSGLNLTENLAPLRSQTTIKPYDQAGTLVSINKSGFV